MATAGVTPAWALRYVTAEEFTLADQYLAASRDDEARVRHETEAARKRELSWERQRATDAAAATTRQQKLTKLALASTVVAAVLLVIAIGAFVWAERAQRAAVANAKLTEQVKLQVENEYAHNLLGRIHSVPTNFGINELPGLWQIAGLPPERENLRTLILSIGLKSSDESARLWIRAPYVAQALVGLDGSRREKFLNELIRPTLKQSTDRSIRLACVRLGIALKLDDVEFAEQAVRVLSDELVQGRGVSIQHALAEDLKAAVRLFPRPEHKRATSPIIEAMKRIPDAYVLRLLCDVLASLPVRLGKDDAQVVLDRLITVIENDPHKGSKVEELRELSRSIRSLPTGLDLDGSGRGTILVTGLITDSGNSEILDGLVEVIRSSAPLMSPLRCRLAAESFRIAMTKAQDSQDATAFARCLTVLTNELAKSDADAAAGQLVSAMKTTDEVDSLRTLATGLSQLPGQLSVSTGRTAIERLLESMKDAKSSRKLRVLAESLALFPEMLLESDLATAKKILLAEIRADGLPPDLEEASRGLSALPVTLSTDDALPSENVLLNLLNRVSKPKSVDSLSTALNLLAGKMQADAVEAAAKPILAAMQAEPAREKILALVNGLHGMDRNKQSLLSAEVVREVYQIVLDKMNDEGDSYFSQPINLSILAESLALAPGETPENVANAAIQKLLDAMVKTDNPVALESLAEGLRAVGGTNVSADAGHQASTTLLKRSRSRTQPRCGEFWRWHWRPSRSN
jgi:hypothetical protein